MRRPFLFVLRLTQHLRQLRNVHRNPSRLILTEQLGGPAKVGRREAPASLGVGAGASAHGRPCGFGQMKVYRAIRIREVKERRAFPRRCPSPTRPISSTDQGGGPRIEGPALALAWPLVCFPTGLLCDVTPIVTHDRFRGA